MESFIDEYHDYLFYYLLVLFLLLLLILFCSSFLLSVLILKFVLWSALSFFFESKEIINFVAIVKILTKHSNMKAWIT